MRSAKALRVPGTVESTPSMSRPMRPISVRSGPRTLTPTGVRKPVASISVRVMIGIQKMLGMPGKRIVRSISSLRRSQVMPFRHSLSGLRVTTVSNMLSGAGSVGVSARPALPKTRSTSGNCLSMRSWTWSAARACVTDMPGSAVGM